jgi:hypothetical protein
MNEYRKSEGGFWTVYDTYDGWTLKCCATLDKARKYAKSCVGKHKGLVMDIASPNGHCVETYHE